MIDCAAIFQPPERLAVSDAAEKYVFLNNPPAYVGYYKNDTTPYMREPMDVFSSRDFTGEVFVSSAQSAKTQALILNTLAYTIKCNPGDVILYNPSQAAARDFSMRRVDRLHRYSQDLKTELVPGRHADNTFDKHYRSGMMLTLSWPSVNEMSGKPVPITMLTDYDRMPMDVEGEGSPFDLAAKRTTTFRSFAMTVAESSPSKEVLDVRWKGDPKFPHLAPPTEGILALYNRGDRRRWFWPCSQCGEFFEGSFSMLRWEALADPSASAETTYMVCPHNGCMIRPEDRYEMNLKGRWLREGEKIDKHGKVSGTPTRSSIASFWLKGVAAAFTTWPNLVKKQLDAELDYQRTGSTEALKTTVNTDQGEPYFPKELESARLPEDIQSQAKPLPEKKVPRDVRALFATCDVQKNRFEVQVQGILPGNPYNIVVVDRFAIVKSERKDEDGERLWVKPSEHPEDWMLLLYQVIEKKYPLEDGTGEMAVSMTICDSGGKAGVTGNAYLFYLELKRLGKHSRFMLCKGETKPNAPRVHLEFPDSERKDRLAKARGEVPVLMLNSNVLKDSLNGMLPTPERQDDAVDEEATRVTNGRIIFPDWLPDTFFEELTVEVRTPKGWDNPHKRRNEAWDLLYYCLGLCTYRRLEHIDWSEPPAHLSQWETNPFVTLAHKTSTPMTPTTTRTLAQLGETLG